MKIRSFPLPLALGVVIGGMLGALPTAALVGAAVDQDPSQFDGTSPSLTVSPPEFVIGSSIDAAQAPGGECDSYWNTEIPMRLRWTGSDSVSGIASYAVFHETDGGRERHDVAEATSFTYNANSFGGDCGGGSDWDGEYWVRAQDNRGNSSMSAQTSEYIGRRVWQETGLTSSGGSGIVMTRSGNWAISRCACFNHGQTLYTTASGASLTYTVNVSGPGQTVAIVAPKNTNRGVMRISVDGSTATNVDTYAPSAQNRIIIWQRSLSVGTHTVRVVNAATAGRPRIDVDTIMLGPGLANLPRDILE